MCLHHNKDEQLAPSPAETPSQRCHRWVETISYPFVTYLVLTHTLAAWGVSVLGQVQPMTLLWAFVMYIIGGFGITAGAHRLWSHRSYKGTFSMRVIMMIFNSVAAQGSIYHWARDHRVHHKHSETRRDPHNASRGFFYAHVGWLILKKEDCVKEAGRKLDMSDLLEDEVVAFQTRYAKLMQVFWAFVFPTVVASKLWNEFFAALFIATARLLPRLLPPPHPSPSVSLQSWPSRRSSSSPTL
jgi:stearoyl-CoA desaturase (delta-9 desaturase)